MGGQQSVTKSAKQTDDKMRHDIIDMVISGKFESDLKLKEHEEKTLEVEKIDPEQPLKDIATNFVVREFFKSESSLYSFMFTTYNYFTIILNEYKLRRGLLDNDLIFIYKGGNILRIVSKEFWLELPSNSTRELTKIYSPYFKRSDSDFTIYLSPHIKNYDIIYNEVGLLSYLILHRLRKVFLSTPYDFFDYYQYNDTLKKSILEKYLTKLNQIEGFNFKGLALDDISTSDYGASYETLPDSGIFKKTDKTFKKVKIINSNSFLINSYNNMLEFARGVDKDRLAKFTLVRTKVNLSLSSSSGEIKSIGGELIDVSIQHRDDISTVHFFEHINLFKTTYELLYMEEKLSINSYTITYLIYDLEEILFRENRFPWEDKKYHKRLYRLFYMYFVDIFVTINDGNIRYDILNDFENMILETYKKNRGNIKRQSRNFVEKYDNTNVKIISLLYALYDISNNIKYIDDEKKFEELIDILIENNKSVLKTIDKVFEYCQYDGIVDREDIYNTSSKVLI